MIQPARIANADRPNLSVVIILVITTTIAVATLVELHLLLCLGGILCYCCELIGNPSPSENSLGLGFRVYGFRV